MLSLLLSDVPKSSGWVCTSAGTCDRDTTEAEELAAEEMEIECVFMWPGGGGGGCTCSAPMPPGLRRFNEEELDDDDNADIDEVDEDELEEDEGLRLIETGDADWTRGLCGRGPPEYGHGPGDSKTRECAGGGPVAP